MLSLFPPLEVAKSLTVDLSEKSENHPRLQLVFAVTGH